MNTRVTCQDVLDALYELIDCEECDRRSGLIDAGSVPGPDARARALMIQHVATCEHCSDAPGRRTPRARPHARLLRVRTGIGCPARPRRRLHYERVRQLALNLARGCYPLGRVVGAHSRANPRIGSRIDEAW